MELEDAWRPLTLTDLHAYPLETSVPMQKVSPEGLLSVLGVRAARQDFPQWSNRDATQITVFAAIELVRPPESIVKRSLSRSLTIAPPLALVTV